MEKLDEFLIAFDSDVEPAIEPPVKPARRPIVPRPPMTQDAYEAGLELLAMMGAKPEDLSEERLNKLRKIWE